MQSRGTCPCTTTRVHAQSRAQSSQHGPKLSRRHIVGLLPLAVIVPPANADEGNVTLVSKAENLSGYQAQVLEYNLRIQRQNNAPEGFPSFIRDKFDITVIAEGYQVTPEGAVIMTLMLQFLLHIQRCVKLLRQP
jgi:hypothetical protein